MNKTNAVIYNDSCGMFEDGIPARDLSSDEWSSIERETQERLLSNGIYFLADTEEAKNVLSGRIKPTEEQSKKRKVNNVLG